MAVGDVVNGCGSIAGAGGVSYQPAAGVEVALTMAGGSELNASGYNGTNLGILTNSAGADKSAGLGIGSGSGTALVTVINALMYVTNTNYLRLRNADGTNPEEYFYCGVQIG